MELNPEYAWHGAREVQRKKPLKAENPLSVRGTSVLT